AFLCLHLTYNFQSSSLPENIRTVRILLSLIILHSLNSFLFQFCINGYQYLAWALPLGLLYGPVFYIGAQRERGDLFDLRKYILHFLPFFFGMFFYVVLLFSYLYREQCGYMHYLLLHIAIGISFFSYSAWRLKTPQLDQNGLRKMIHILFMVLAVGIIVPKLGEFFLQLDGYNSVTSYVWTIGTLFILLCLYQLLVNSLRSTVIPVSESIAVEISQPIIAEIKNDIQKEDEKIEAWRSHIQKIEKYMLCLPYLQDDFDIKKMSSDVDIPRYVLNEFFTEYYKETFAKKVNFLRIAHACTVLSSDHYELNIDELWKQCGFRSRASFYRNFSQVQGCTPLEYRNNYILTK